MVVLEVAFCEDNCQPKVKSVTSLYSVDVITLW